MKIVIFKVLFKLVHGGYGVEFIDQERINMYIRAGRRVVKQEEYMTYQFCDKCFGEYGKCSCD